MYSKTGSIRIRLTDKFTGDAQLKNYVKVVQHPTGGADMGEALNNAKKLFAGSKPKGQDVLVIMTDSRTTGDKAMVQPMADELYQMGVKIITVAVGGSSDPAELRRLSPNKNSSLKEFPDENPKHLGDRIIEQAVLRKSVTF